MTNDGSYVSGVCKPGVAAKRLNVIEYDTEHMHERSKKIAERRREWRQTLSELEAWQRNPCKENDTAVLGSQGHTDKGIVSVTFGESPLAVCAYISTNGALDGSRLEFPKLST